MMLDRIIFGDNQFFGINHMSEEKAQSLAEKFKDLKAITDIIAMAYDCGIRAFMLNSNERAKEICDYLRDNISRYPDLRLYPSIPYPYKYANLVAEKGIFATLKDVIVSDSTAGNIASLITKAGSSLFEKDMLKVMQILIDIEMKIFRDLNVKVVFLQNIVADLLLGFGVKDLFVAFASYIKDKYGVEAGFVTLNMPKMVEVLLDCGIENPVVCSAINKAGYFMNPDMSILASGAVKPGEAVEYVCRQPAIQSIVFGASTREHIADTKELIESYS